MKLLPTPPPIKKSMPDLGIIMQVFYLLYISSRLLALGISSTLNLNAQFYPLPLPQSIRFQCLPVAYKIKNNSQAKASFRYHPQLSFQSQVSMQPILSHAEFFAFPRICCMFSQLPVLHIVVPFIGMISFLFFWIAQFILKTQLKYRVFSDFSDSPKQADWSYL